MPCDTIDCCDESFLSYQADGVIYDIITEAGDFLTTESSDFLTTE